MSLYTLFRKFIILAIGLPILVFGIILIPVPGPGLLVTFLGLIILASEFDWAKKYSDPIRLKLSQIIANARARAR